MCVRIGIVQHPALVWGIGTVSVLFQDGLAEYLKRGDRFVKEYDRLLQETGKNDIATVAKLMKIDIRKPDFWRASLAIVGNDIDTFCAL